MSRCAAYRFIAVPGQIALQPSLEYCAPRDDRRVDCGSEHQRGSVLGQGWSGGPAGRAARSPALPPADPHRRLQGLRGTSVDPAYGRSLPRALPQRHRRLDSRQLSALLHAEYWAAQLAARSARQLTAADGPPPVAPVAPAPNNIAPAAPALLGTEDGGAVYVVTTTGLETNNSAAGAWVGVVVVVGGGEAMRGVAGAGPCIAAVCMQLRGRLHLRVQGDVALPAAPPSRYGAPRPAPLLCPPPLAAATTCGHRGPPPASLLPPACCSHLCPPAPSPPPAAAVVLPDALAQQLTALVDQLQSALTIGGSSASPSLTSLWNTLVWVTVALVACVAAHAGVRALLIWRRWRVPSFFMVGWDGGGAGGAGQAWLLPAAIPRRFLFLARGAAGAPACACFLPCACRPPTPLPLSALPAAVAPARADSVLLRAAHSGGARSA